MRELIQISADIIHLDNFSLHYSARLNSALDFGVHTVSLTVRTLAQDLAGRLRGQIRMNQWLTVQLEK